ncbi:MAG: MarR family transcriptional regulator [Burkholderiaceae bacterium]|jgi:DNA-binding MarR family transcriptional regulator|nr:MarR family transcriptional regulator [Burkholderiaceae bacterium]
MPSPAHDRHALMVELMLLVFRINGALLAGGDRMVAPLGLSSARWQVLGAIALAQTPLTAPQIGAAMGISRQGVQKQLARLCDEALLAALPNPRHERSPQYQLTARGQKAYASAMALNDAWVGELVRPLSKAQLSATVATLNTLSTRLSGDAAS